VATVFADSPIHVVGELSKPQTWNNEPMNQAFSILTPSHREYPGFCFKALRRSGRELKILKILVTIKINFIAKLRDTRVVYVRDLVHHFQC
jgi:hypothetical protein